MPKLTRRSVILAKQESSYGVNAEPDASDGILVNEGVSISPGGQKIERKPVRDSLSPLGHVIGSKEMSIDIQVEGKGGGVNTGTVLPPEYEPLLMACAMQKTSLAVANVNSSAGFAVGESVQNGSGASGVVHFKEAGILYLSGVSGTISMGDTLTGTGSSFSSNVTAAPGNALEYRPVSAPALMKSATVYFYKDGILHAVRGCRGSWSLECTVGRIPTFRFSLRGLYSDPTDQSLPTPTLLSLTPPVCFNLNLTIGSYYPVANSLQINLNNEITPRNDFNATDGITEFMITGRNPGGSIDPEADDLADFNPFNSWKNATTAGISATIGQNAGNRVRLVVPYALYSDIRYSDRNGLMAYDLPFICQGSTDDELRVIFS